MMDQLAYFDLRARGEAIRMIYAVAGKEFEDKRVSSEEWLTLKPDTPLGQIPVLKTPEGDVVLSNSIARHVGRKLGLVGTCGWEETLHDVLVEVGQEMSNTYAAHNVYRWLIFKSVPTPENSEEILQNIKESYIKLLKYVETIAEKRGKKYIVGDELGIGELFLYAAMEFVRGGIPDVMRLTPWTEKFIQNLTEDPKLKPYLAKRPDAAL